MRFVQWHGRVASYPVFWLLLALVSLWRPSLAYSERLDVSLQVAQAPKSYQIGVELQARRALPVASILDDDREDQNPPESFSKGFQALWEDSIYLVTSPARMTLRDSLVLGGVLAGIGGLFAADHGIQHFVEKNTTHTGRDVADVFNGIGSPAAVLGLNVGLIAIGVTAWSYTGDSRLKNAALVSLESEIFTLASVFIIQEVVGRANPEQHKGVTHFRPFSKDDSFPSGHAAVSFSTAAVFADRYEQQVGVIAYGMASAVALARVYSDKHFASDVVAGGLLGWVIGKALSARHSYLDSDIEIRPLILDRGQAIGIMVVKLF